MKAAKRGVNKTYIFGPACLPAIRSKTTCGDETGIRRSRSGSPACRTASRSKNADEQESEPAGSFSNRRLIGGTRPTMLYSRNSGRHRCLWLPYLYKACHVVRCHTCRETPGVYDVTAVEQTAKKRRIAVSWLVNESSEDSATL